MPLTPIQKDVLAVLAFHRTAESHAGGGAIINRTDSSPRYSRDLDFFHDTASSALACAEADVAALVQNGFGVGWELREASLYKAKVSRGSEELRLDWCHDTPFRFFPVLPDAEFGYCYHPADVAVNKTLAMAGRLEIRDFLDILFLHETYLPLGALCWAACGKDQGYTPPLLLDCAKRNMCFRDADLAKERLVRRPRLTDVKQAWLKVASEAEDWCSRMPAGDLGCLYLGPDALPLAPKPNQSDLASVIRHFGSVSGAWPTVAPTPGPADRD